MARMGAALRRRLEDFVRDGGIEWKRDVTDSLTTQLSLLASKELVMSQVAAVRADMSLLASKELVTSQIAAVRVDMTLLASKELLTNQIAALRVEMAEGFAQLRREMAEGFAQIRKEMADQRVELLRWTFIFWLGQVAATAGLIGLALRYAR